MIKKFAAVGVIALVVVGLTNCTGDAGANAIQQNTKKVAVFEDLSMFNLTKQLTILEQRQKHYQKIERNTVRMEKILKYLKTRKNKTPYVFAGSSPKWGWDCSGLVLWTYEQFGITLKHSATAQAHSGTRVSYKNAKPGDIVTFSWGSDYWHYHAAIYLGNGMIIDANNGYGTTVVQPLTNFKGNKIRFSRIVQTN